ncbi:MAG: formate--tetrahydrofolate ligase, partial [Bacteroidia bacterium]
MTDIEIARTAEIKPIRQIADKLNIPEADLHYYGRHKAKLPLHLINEDKAVQSNLILVSAISPTPAG